MNRNRKAAAKNANPTYVNRESSVRWPYPQTTMPTPRRASWIGVRRGIYSVGARVDTAALPTAGITPASLSGTSISIRSIAVENTLP